MVRIVLYLSLLALIGACDIGHATQPCAKTGADPNGKPYCPLSAAQVKALPEAELYYPGSQVVWSVVAGGKSNVNGEPTEARVRRGLSTNATGNEVRAWYDATLKSAGWTVFVGGHYPYLRQPPNSTYREFFDIAINPSPPQDQPQPRSGSTYYEVIFAVPT